MTVMQWAKQRQTGFTIVELLIVVVVIAILAAITIVSYNGIQQQALNTKVVTGVNQYQKALLNYHTLKGQYPANGSCMGKGYPDDQCWKGESGTHGVSAAFDTAMSEVLSAKPELATARFSIGIGDNTRAGALYSTSGGVKRIVYYLQGINQNCALGAGVNEGSRVTQCSYVLPGQE